MRHFIFNNDLFILPQDADFDVLNFVALLKSLFLHKTLLTHSTVVFALCLESWSSVIFSSSITVHLLGFQHSCEDSSTILETHSSLLPEG